MQNTAKESAAVITAGESSTANDGCNVKSLMAFDFDTAPVRVITKDGEPWFVARDVCAVLDLDINSGARDLPEDEKGLHTTQTPGGLQSLTVVNEPGLYRMIFRSRKPEADKFKHWVFHEVLPSIRKNGEFSVVKNEEKDKAKDIRKQIMQDTDLDTLVYLNNRLISGERLNNKTMDYLMKLRMLVGNSTMAAETLPGEDEEFDDEELLILRHLRQCRDGANSQRNMMRLMNIPVWRMYEIGDHLYKKGKLRFTRDNDLLGNSVMMWHAVDGVVGKRKSIEG